MKAFLLAILGLLAAAVPALADETCVEVEIGGERVPAFNCLNQKLQKQVDSVHPAENIAPLSATSSSVRLGGYNETALKQQYGANYGQSAIPWRPASAYGGSLH
jgi:hypothetical protein